MSPELRLTVIADATFKLLMVNPSIIVEYAYKVVASPSEHPAHLVQLARDVVAEQNASAIPMIPEFKPIMPRRTSVAIRQTELQPA